jgi:unspecific monooxygenase
VITVASDVVFFECFSADESSYGCLTVNRDTAFGPSAETRLGTTNVDYSWDLFDHFQSLHMLDREPPDHTRLKALVMKAFTPQRVESLRGKIEQIVNRLLDKVEPAGRMDIHHDLAEPLPVTVIAELLGVPEEHRHKLRPWSGDIVKLYELGYSEEQVHRASNAVVEFSNFLRGLIDERRSPQRTI